MSLQNKTALFSHQNTGLSSAFPGAPCEQYHLGPQTHYCYRKVAYENSSVRLLKKLRKFSTHIFCFDLIFTLMMDLGNGPKRLYHGFVIISIRS